MPAETIIVLYVLGAALPLIGVGKSLWRISADARRYQHRTKYKRKIRDATNARLDVATTQDEKDLAHAWSDAEMAKRDKWGDIYARSDEGFGTTSKGRDAAINFKPLFFDAILVVIGVALSTTASIGSLGLS